MHSRTVDVYFLWGTSVHDGNWREAWQRRDAVQQAYYDAHPERFRNRPRIPAPAGLVGINQPKPEPQPQPA
jgi:hypothetical protein